MPVNLSVVTAVVRRQLYQGQPGTAAGLLYTVPAGTDVRVFEVLLCNTTDSTAHFTLYMVPSGGSPSQTNAVLSQMQLAARETAAISLSTFLGPASMLYASQQTTNALTATISGETYS